MWTSLYIYWDVPTLYTTYSDVWHIIEASITPHVLWLWLSIDTSCYLLRSSCFTLIHLFKKNRNVSTLAEPENWLTGQYLKLTKEHIIKVGDYSLVIDGFFYENFKGICPVGHGLHPILYLKINKLIIINYVASII